MTSPEEVLRNMLRDVTEAIVPHLVTIREDGLPEITGMFADSADRLTRHVLDQAVHRGEIACYDYDSILDPFTETLHARAGLVIPVSPERIIIDLKPWLPDSNAG